MDSVLRAAGVYVVLLVIFRLAGRRTIAQMTSFDLILALIVSEGVSQGLTGQDHSVTNALLIAITLVTMDVGISVLKARVVRLDDWLEGRPMIIVEDGKPLTDRMRRARVDSGDVMAAARERKGLERMDQIKYAVLENSGGISIIAKDREQPAKSGA
jgi:uncharacterized membrane protein YcaP (DUF421 family)